MSTSELSWLSGETDYIARHSAGPCCRSATSTFLVRALVMRPATLLQQQLTHQNSRNGLLYLLASDPDLPVTFRDSTRPSLVGRVTVRAISRAASLVRPPGPSSSFERPWEIARSVLRHSPCVI